MTNLFFFGFAAEFIDWLREHREWIYAISFATGVIGVVLSGLRLYSIYWKNSKTDESIEEIKARIDENERQQEDLRQQLRFAELKLNTELARLENEKKEQIEKEQTEALKNADSQSNLEEMPALSNSACNHGSQSDENANASIKSSSGRMKKIVPAAAAVLVPLTGFLLKYCLKSKKKDKNGPASN